jgi:uncharacterized protein YbgA (DUF1722 family)
MGKILGQSKAPAVEKAAAYRDVMLACMEKPYKTSNVINVFEHALGYFSEKLSAPEKKFFIDTMNKYREGKAHIAVPLSLMKSYVVRFNQEYLKMQSFFFPYPEEIMEKAFYSK